MSFAPLREGFLRANLSPRQFAAKSSLPPKLLVNLNKVCLLRNSRGGRSPDPSRYARSALELGAAGITLHPRPDCRHARPDDVLEISAICKAKGAEFCLEGNHRAQPNARWPGFSSLVELARPTQVTLVPDQDGQLTSDHGWDLAAGGPQLRDEVAALSDLGPAVSIFIDPDPRALEVVLKAGSSRLEIYTGPYAEAFARGDEKSLLASCAELAKNARAAGVGVNAGHDLDLDNLPVFLQATGGLVREVSVGHSLIGLALKIGFRAAVKKYLEIL